MKTYHGLWDIMMSEENIRLSIQKAAKGKKSKRLKKKLSDAKADPDRYIPIMRNYAENYKNRYHAPVRINDNTTRKPRVIIIPDWREQILHHMIVRTLMPLFTKGMYAHSYGSVPGRGALMGKKKIEKWGMAKYCLQMDVKKFFDSVDQNILLSQLDRRVKDDKFMTLLTEIIHAVPKGLPLGFYTSQWFANFYLQGLDHYIADNLKYLHSGHYIRYMDDMVVMGNNKRKLHKARELIEQYLGDRLRLQAKWQVYRTWHPKYSPRCRPISFMGYKFYRDRTILRRGIYYHTVRKARNIKKKEKPTWYDAVQFMSLNGWWVHTDTRMAFREYVLPCIDIKKLKTIISKHSRRQYELETIAVYG